MKLKDFKAMINAYHDDYDDCEVGTYNGNDWSLFDRSVPISEGLSPDVRIALLFNSGDVAVTGDYGENSKKG